MSTIDFAVDQIASRVEAHPETVRGLLKRGMDHLPEGAPVNRDTMMATLKATRDELSDPEEIRILERIEDQFNGMSMLKQMLVFSTISSDIDELRRELKG